MEENCPGILNVSTPKFNEAGDVVGSGVLEKGEGWGVFVVVALVRVEEVELAVALVERDEHLLAATVMESELMGVRVIEE